MLISVSCEPGAERAAASERRSPVVGVSADEPPRSCLTRLRALFSGGGRGGAPLEDVASRPLEGV